MEIGIRRKRLQVHAVINGDKSVRKNLQQLSKRFEAITAHFTAAVQSKW